MWQNLTSGQGTVIAAVITFVAAIAGVILGWVLFSGRVKNLETAIATSEVKVKSHIQSVEDALNEYESKLNEQLASFALQVAHLSASVADNPDPPSAIPTSEQNDRDKLRENWTRIRDRLEEIAANPKIDGRRRAKYGRIDRRRYQDLVTALESDGALGSDASTYRQAVDLWQRFRSGRSTPSSQDVEAMQRFAKLLNGVFA